MLFYELLENWHFGAFGEAGSDHHALSDAGDFVDEDNLDPSLRK
jgi:hypothetical protein